MVISAHKFNWDSTHGTTFASDIHLKPGQVPTEFTLRNEKRGTTAKFKHCQTNRDGEGDILSWSFKSICGRLLTTIFND